MRQRVSSLFGAFVRSRSGTTAMEYALIAGAISVAIAATVPLIGTNVAARFATIGAALQ